MPRHDRKTGELVYQTDSKKYEASSEYLDAVMGEIRKIGDTITNNQSGYENPNFDIHTQYILALLIDPDERTRLRDYRKKRIEREIPEGASSRDVYMKMFEINMDTIGEVVSVFDEFLGIITKQEIIRVKSPRVKQYEKEYLASRGLE